MEIKHFANKVLPRKPAEFWLMTGSTVVALAGLLLTVPMRTVQADALLSIPQGHTAAGAAVNGTTPAMKPAEPSVFERGVASWYGSVFHGRLTASGERFNMYRLTACHPTLPFGTMVKVTNLENHRSVVVRITDRGYLYPGRIIDLSFAAARKLQMAKEGLADVSLEVLPPTPGVEHP